MFLKGPYHPQRIAYRPGHHTSPKVHSRSLRAEERKRSKFIRVSNVPYIIKEPINKDDNLFQVDIQEFSNINLYQDDLVEVRALAETTRLPERLALCLQK